MSQADEEQPLPEAEEAELLAALEAALRPGELDEAVNERLIEMALEDPLAAPSEDELAESARLRDALERETPHEDAALLSALRSAAQPGIDGPSADEAAVERALQGAVPPPAPARRGNVVYVAFGAVSAALAAAAMLLLFVGTMRSAAPTAASAPVSASEFAKPRTTAPLFTERFETGDTTARIDLIASARSRDLRDNRYASWGVK